MDDDRTAALLIEIDRLRSEVERLRATEREARPSPSRRQALKLAGAATAGALAGGLAAATPAAANDPNDITKNVVNATTATTTVTGSFGTEIVRVENTATTGRAVYATSGQVDVSAIRGDNLNDSGIGGIGVGGYAPGGRDLFAFGSGRIAMNPHSFSTSANSYVTGEIHQVAGTLYLMVTPTRRSLGGPGSAGALYPVNPTRVYDSRRPTPSPGRLTGAGNSRIVSVADGRNLSTGAVTVPDLVPVGATAIAYNLGVTQTVGPGFLAVAAGTAAGFSASAINWSASNTTIANASVVPIDAARQIKVFSGSAGGTHLFIDVVGYYV